MFGLLNPFLLWFAPLVAAPLVIHFLGRARPRERDFPSLLPVRGLAVRAMQRHRLKNWLQLILRTLALACIVLAAAGPVWRAGGFAPPEAAALLLHNGAWAEAPAPAGGNYLQSQQRLARALDSLAPGRGPVERVIPDADGPTVARFGDWPAAASRLLLNTPGRAAHVFLPVFDARDLEALAPSLRAWLEAPPLRSNARRAILLDYTEARRGLDAFGEVAAEFRPDGTVALRVSTRARKAPLWMNSRNSQSTRETRLDDGVAEIALPLPESGWIRGAFVVDEAERERYAPSAVAQAVSLRVPAPLRICHVASPGSAAATRAALGEEGPRLRIVSVAGNEAGPEACGALVLGDPENAGPWLARAASVLRAGGRVIVGAGIHSDVALLNRNLLAPLGVGRFTAIRAGKARIAAHAAGLARLGARASAWGEPGRVRMRLGLAPAEGTTVLLTAGEGARSEPLLVHRRVGKGEILVWATDIGDPAWSDLGAGPWPALLHAAFLEGMGSARPELRAVDSDSSVFLPVDGDRATLIGPDGRPSPRWRAEAGGVRAGPFDRVGAYRLAAGEGISGDTLEFAVRLAPERLAPEPRDAWKAFDEALGPVAASRTARLEHGDDWRALYGGFGLRTALLILAALLLFAEGVVSLRLSPLRNLGNRT